MKRRRVLQSLAILPGVGLLSGAGQQPVAPKAARGPIDETPTLQVATTDSAAETVEQYFSESQFQALQRLSDIIAPAISGVPGALAAGVPLIATRVGGVPLLTGDGARLVPPGDGTALAAAMRDLLDDPPAAAALAARGSARARALPDAEATAEGVLAVYTELLDRR